VKLQINIEIGGKYHVIKLNNISNPSKIAASFLKDNKLNENLASSLASNI